MELPIPHLEMVPTVLPFSHTGISYNPDKCEITFSSEAMTALQSTIDTVQSDLPNESIMSDNETLKVKDITSQTAQVFADAMVVSGEGKKSVKKFMERTMLLLKGKKLKPSKVEKVEEKIKKHGQDNIYAHIFIQYTEGKELKILGDTPIIVRPGESTETMMKSFKTRLKFTRMKK